MNKRVRVMVLFLTWDSTVVCKVITDPVKDTTDDFRVEISWVFYNDVNNIEKWYCWIWTNFNASKFCVNYSLPEKLIHWFVVDFGVYYHEIGSHQY